MINTHNKIKKLNAMIKANDDNFNLILERKNLIEKYMKMSPSTYVYQSEERKEYDFGQLSESDVKFLYSIFIEGLKKIPFEKTTIKCLNLITIPTNCDYDQMAKEHNNNYTKNKKLDFLGDDVIANGTYWPVVVNEKAGPVYSILEGSHRVEAVKNKDMDYEFFLITSNLDIQDLELTIKIPYADDIEYLKAHINYGPIYRLGTLRVGENGLFYYATFSRDIIRTFGNLFVIYFVNAFGVGLRNYMELYKLKPCDLPGNEYINNKKNTPK
ncbi:MAG: ParB N-terminal domain-containing protein [Fusobacteriaceae bacterium]